MAKINFTILMRLLTAIMALIALIVNGMKLLMPFGKVVVIADGNNWIAINYDSIIRRMLISKHAVIRLPFRSRRRPQVFSVDANFRNIEYKGINLYRISEYNICVALEVLPANISFENERHRTVIAEWFALSTECIDFFENVVLKKRPDKVLISQGHNFDAAIMRAFACLHGFKIIAVENTLNKNKIVWEDISGITVNKNLAKNYYWKYRDFVSEVVAENYVSEYLENIKLLKTGDHQTPITSVAKTDKKTILFIGQVYTDSSVLFGINDFPCPIAIIDYLVDYCLVNDYHLIIKLHPKEEAGHDILDRSYDNLTYNKIANHDGLLGKIATGGFVLDKGSYDTYSLIDCANVCVTVNSQAGLEALIKGKDLIVCGQGYYTGLGFTYEALNIELLKFFLDLVLKREMSILNKVEINKFFYIVLDMYFVNRSTDAVKMLLLKEL